PVGFPGLQQRSRRFGDWDGAVTRWCKTEILKPGKNVISGALHPPNDYAISAALGKVIRFEAFMYHPWAGERIQIDDIRLSGEKVAATPPATSFDVAGVGIKVASGQELGETVTRGCKRRV